MLLQNNRVKWFILAVLFCFNILAWLAVYELGSDGFLEVSFFDVGQGDAILIETSQGHQILIDGGQDSTILEKLSAQIPFWDRTLDLIILTHPDSDHLTGLLEVLANYEIENILWTGVEKETNTFSQWFQKIKEEKANVVLAKKGIKIKAGKTELYILYPLEALEKRICSQDCNDTSLVAKLVFGKNTFLFPGDITQKSEKILLENSGAPQDLEAQVLKVAHHGSKTSSSEEFLKTVQPEIAVISCVKDNRFGFPAPEAMIRLEKFAKEILSTAGQGDIKIISDGEHLSILLMNAR